MRSRLGHQGLITTLANVPVYNLLRLLLGNRKLTRVLHHQASLQLSLGTRACNVLCSGC